MRGSTTDRHPSSPSQEREPSQPAAPSRRASTPDESPEFEAEIARLLTASPGRRISSIPEIHLADLRALAAATPAPAEREPSSPTPAFSRALPSPRAIFRVRAPFEIR
jgi:hypothetical protein